ncbi:hypothetical protein [Nostoc sp.]|uniref:hypothetical protein n=1 Tax=Nostoc sp. TaxID=1180 RepID=UPI002FFB179A
MTTEEEIKAAIVVFPDAIVYASPELNTATDFACHRLHKFVDYIQTLDPELERYEAIILGAAVLDGLPALFEANPEILAGIKSEAKVIRGKRQK